MLIVALICGLVTAYYFGVRLGAYAAAIAAALALVALVVPGWASWAYGALAAGLIGVCVCGPRFGKPLAARKLVMGARRVVREVRRRRG